MPIYTLRCCRCNHQVERGFTVAGFTAQMSQGFHSLFCPRCKRRAVLSHDFMADARTQSTHGDEYTFRENAPEDHLVGKTVTKKEAKAILKKHNLVEAGREAKRDSANGRRRYTEKEIKDRWSAMRSNDTPAPVVPSVPPERPPASVPRTVSDKKSLNLLRVDKMSNKEEVDSDNVSKASIATTWPALKKQARDLGIKVPRSMKRPELERLVRTTLVS